MRRDRPAQTSEIVHVIGFPKSGNTWLHRLISDTLAAPWLATEPDDQRYAFLFNTRRGYADGPWATMRTHRTPKAFEDLGIGDVHRRVYIVRDLRDVVVSAFFFTHGPDCEELLLRRDPLPLARRLTDPLSTLKRLYWRQTVRRDFERFARSISKAWSADFGNWSEHVLGWRRYACAHPETRLAFITYEELKRDTTATLSGALQAIGVEFDAQRLNEAVARNVLARLREDHEAMARERAAALPADAPRRVTGPRTLVRRGRVGDHRSYFSGRTHGLIEREHGALLRHLGYLRADG